MKLRVMHMPYCHPVPIFYVPVSSVAEGKKVIETLWEYDHFLNENKLKHDHSDCTILEFYNPIGKCWEPWQDEEGYRLDELIKAGADI